MPFTKEQAKEKTAQLIEKFKRDLESGKVKHFNEEQTKKDYIEPLFECLNWDIRDSDEVSVEERVSKGRVDYGFRIDGIPKFYVEAKSFKEDLNNIDYIGQAINYAHLRSVTWAVLTNFEGLKVFNAEWESKNPRDKIYIDLKWDNFLDNFNRIWLISKDSFLNNELDKEAEEYGKKIKKTLVTPVMAQIFNDLMSWREELTKNISNYSANSKVVRTEEELDEAVQRIIDRLIFIRVCEDRQIEGRILQQTVREWLNNHKDDLVNRLNKIFRDFDDGYDSKLFQPHPCENLKIDNSILIDIINNLYKSSDGVFDYDFSAIDSDVLGNIYEEYLGYILKKGKKKSGLKENHAYRKEMGIYYTPTFVVDYIVKNTIGRFLEENPKINNTKILDMACGSGSFLLKSYDFLVKYHKNELDFLRKISILTNNIYGVDLDPKSIEIAQLNLLLKTLEKRRLLPKLQENLKVGNSLIEDSKFSERAFKWDSEFKGKFDIIIGNPPYIRNTELSGKDKKYFNENYSSAYKQYDIYILFFENALRLLKNKGYLGFITSNKFIASEYGENLRKLILEKCKIIALIDMSHLRVFKDASTYPVITILQKEENEILRNRNKIKFQSIENVRDLQYEKNLSLIEQSTFLKSDDNRFSERKDKEFTIIKKIEENTNLISDLFSCQRGSPKNKIKILNEKTINSLSCIISKDVNRYYPTASNSIFVISNLQNNVISKEKILLPRTVLRVRSAYEKGGNFIMDRIYYLIPKTSVKINLKFVTGVLNSKLIDFYYKTNFGTTHVGGGYLDLRGAQIVRLPIKIPSDKQQKEIVELVNKILELKGELQKVNSQSDKGFKLQEEINRVDKKIDQEIYKLYNLSEKEIDIIEAS